MLFFLRLGYSAGAVCGHEVYYNNEFISSRKTNSSRLKFSGSGYTQAEGNDGLQWTSESNPNFGQWIQFEFLTEKVKIESYYLKTYEEYESQPVGWTFEASNNNKTFTLLQDCSNCFSECFQYGMELPVDTSSYFHIFRVKFKSASIYSCDYIKIYEFLLNGTVLPEIFKPYVKKIVCTCRIKRGFIPSLSYLFPLIYTYVV